MMPRSDASPVTPNPSTLELSADGPHAVHSVCFRNASSDCFLPPPRNYAPMAAAASTAVVERQAPFNDRMNEMSRSRSQSIMSKRAALIVTCEHGGNRIPRRWATLFRGRRTWLRSHRGYDLGAAPVAKHVADALHAPLFIATTS